MPTFKGSCDTCTRPIMGPSLGESGASGYGRDDLGRRHCFVCCGEHDVAYMRKRGRNTLYLTLEAGAVTDGRAMPMNDHEAARKAWKVSNWPGSLEIRPLMVRKGYHNMARVRYDVWFRFDGKTWHGVQYGDNTQILHCRQTKAA